MTKFPSDPDYDARTLAEAEAIKLDPQRSIAAREAATQMSRQMQVQAQQLDIIASRSPQRSGPEPATPAVMQSGDGRAIPVTRSRRR